MACGVLCVWMPSMELRRSAELYYTATFLAGSVSFLRQTCLQVLPPAPPVPCMRTSTMTVFSSSACDRVSISEHQDMATTHHLLDREPHAPPLGPAQSGPSVSSLYIRPIYPQSSVVAKVGDTSVWRGGRSSMPAAAADTFTLVCMHESIIVSECVCSQRADPGIQISKTPRLCGTLSAGGSPLSLQHSVVYHAGIIRI